MRQYIQVIFTETGATIRVANLVNYKCHPEEDGNHGLHILIAILLRMAMKMCKPLWSQKVGSLDHFSIIKYEQVW